jgi:hypothetical protein
MKRILDVITIGLAIMFLIGICICLFFWQIFAIGVGITILGGFLLAGISAWQVWEWKFIVKNARPKTKIKYVIKVLVTLISLVCLASGLYFIMTLTNVGMGAFLFLLGLFMIIYVVPQIWIFVVADYSIPRIVESDGMYKDFFEEDKD